jgi:beta-lactamase regulating signal transducer with metallopeptidase domain
MSSFLVSLFMASIAGTALFAAFLTLRPITGGLFSKTWHYYMSFLPVFLLLGGAVLFTFMAGAQADSARVYVDYAFIAEPPDFLTIESPSDLPLPGQDLQAGSRLDLEILASLTNIIRELGAALTLVWAIGAVVFAAVNVHRYRMYRRAILESSWSANIQAPVDVVISKNAATPVLLGFLKPLIVLPDVEFSDTELDMVLAHELVHLKRKDVWLKFAVLVANAAHWFNPAAYALNRHINTLCELSCDEKAVMEMGAQERRLYGETILSMLQHGSTQRSLVCASGLCSPAKLKKNMKRRLINVLSTKKSKKTTVALSITVAVLIAGFSVIGIMALGNSLPSIPADEPSAQGYYLPSASDNMQIQDGGFRTRTVDLSQGQATGTLNTIQNFRFLTESGRMRVVFAHHETVYGEIIRGEYGRRILLFDARNPESYIQTVTIAAGENLVEFTFTGLLSGVEYYIVVECFGGNDSSTVLVSMD